MSILDDELLTPRDVARLLAVSETQARRLINERVLPYVRVSARCPRVRRSALERYQAEREVRSVVGNRREGCG